jgi:small subunit ribosomal protein S17
MAENETVVDARTARKVREGLVVSDKMDKTIVVAVVRLKRHPLYGRVQRVTKRIKGARRDQTSARPATASASWRRARFPKTRIGACCKYLSAPNSGDRGAKEIRAWLNPGCLSQGSKYLPAASQHGGGKYLQGATGNEIQRRKK